MLRVSVSSTEMFFLATEDMFLMYGKKLGKEIFFFEKSYFLNKENVFVVKLFPRENSQNWWEENKN